MHRPRAWGVRLLSGSVQGIVGISGFWILWVRGTHYLDRIALVSQLYVPPTIDPSLYKLRRVAV